MSPQYKTVGGYPNTDPYYISPEEETAMEVSRVEGLGLPWHVEPWGDGSKPPYVNICSASHEAVIAADLERDTANFIVGLANGTGIPTLKLEDTAKWVCDLMDAADGALDRDTYDQMREFGELDAPDDAEVYIRVGTRTKLNTLFNAIGELRRAITTAVYHGKRRKADALCKERV